MPDVRVQHTAADPAMGYLYQCRYALLVALQESEFRPDLEVSVERFDDIAFDEQGDPKTMIQTKHQVTKVGDLGDLSTDIWKTLHIWAKQTIEDPQFPSRVRLILVTTGAASEGTAASLLRRDGRNEKHAQELFLNAIKRSRTKSAQMLRCFKSFSDLPPDQCYSLLHCITIIDGSPNVQEVKDEIEKQLIRSTNRDKVPLLVERLEGWWFGRIVAALVHGKTSIPISALENKIDEVRESLTDTSLPVDFHTAEPPEEIVAQCDQRTFVQQLRLINLRDRRIQIAVRDYYRASQQRSRWIREELLVDGELNGYDLQLREAWEPRFHRMKDGLRDDCDESGKITAGEHLYAWVENEAEYPLRTVHHRFLPHGSFHILSNRCIVGWHPEFSDHIHPGVSDGE